MTYDMGKTVTYIHIEKTQLLIILRSVHIYASQIPLSAAVHDWST